MILLDPSWLLQADATDHLGKRNQKDPVWVFCSWFCFFFFLEQLQLVKVVIVAASPFKWHFDVNTVSLESSRKQQLKIVVNISLSPQVLIDKNLYCPHLFFSFQFLNICFTKFFFLTAQPQPEMLSHGLILEPTSD